jgi:hypothetical protein
MGGEMSDTPRTDKAERTADTLGVMDAFEFAIYHGQKLERELAEANERIKNLEEAGDAIADATEEICYDSYDKKQIENWRKAKEGK